MSIENTLWAMNLITRGREFSRVFSSCAGGKNIDGEVTKGKTECAGRNRSA
jgi:hypothetical protein